MVKIKKGYVMSTREQAEFDRMNAMPRKTWGRVDYYFKPQTKYPPRIYLYMHAETWCDRNRRPMGLFYAVPFLSRPMNKEEIEYHHFDIRLFYHQYEDWDKLIYAEEQEAGLLDNENPGRGTEFLNALKSFRQKFPLTDKPVKKVPEAVIKKEVCLTELILDSSVEKVLDGLIINGYTFSANAISTAIEIEQGGYNRKAVMIALKQLYRNVVLEEPQKKILSAEWISRKTELALAQTRRNFVRRVYHRNKLFAMAEISLRYPGYTEEMLMADLKVKSLKPKRKKHKPIVDLRRCQLEKLAAKLRAGQLDESEYQAICCRIVMLQTAHDLRLPIPLTVKLGNETLVYSFDWKTREGVIKSFVTLANSKAMTHDKLAVKYKEITGSRYSF